MFQRQLFGLQNKINIYQNLRLFFFVYLLLSTQTVRTSFSHDKNSVYFVKVWKAKFGWTSTSKITRSSSVSKLKGCKAQVVVKSLGPTILGTVYCCWRLKHLCHTACWTDEFFLFSGRILGLGWFSWRFALVYSSQDIWKDVCLCEFRIC